MPRIEKILKLAVPLEDINTIPADTRANLVSKNLDLASPAKAMNGQVPVMLVPFSCSLLRAAMICDVLRGMSKEIGEKMTQVWIMRDRVWSRIPWGTLLTIGHPQGDGTSKVMLNPLVFGERFRPVEVADVIEPEEVKMRVRKWGETR